MRDVLCAGKGRVLPLPSPLPAPRVMWGGVQGLPRLTPSFRQEQPPGGSPRPTVWSARESPGLASPRSSSRGPGRKDVTPLSPGQRGSGDAISNVLLMEEGLQASQRPRSDLARVGFSGCGVRGGGRKRSKPDSKCVGRWRRETAIGWLEQGREQARSGWRAPLGEQL